MYQVYISNQGEQGQAVVDATECAQAMQDVWGFVRPFESVDDGAWLVDLTPEQAADLESAGYAEWSSEAYLISAEF